MKKTKVREGMSQRAFRDKGRGMHRRKVEHLSFLSRMVLLHNCKGCKECERVSHPPGASSAPELKTKGAGLLDFDAPREEVDDADDDADDDDLIGAYESEKTRERR